MRLLVCGSRNYSDEARLAMVLDSIHRTMNCELVIHGAATGADTMAGQWAAENKIPIQSFPANWTRHGKSAGPKRNIQMLVEGKPELVVAFPKWELATSKGTAHMVRIAQQALVQTVIIQPSGELVVPLIKNFVINEERE